MRAALLPAGSDPFLLAYWLRNYETWAASVDELIITVSGALEPEALDYIEGIVQAAPNARMVHFDHRTDHGMMLEFLVQETQATHVMLCEDDAYVRHPGIVEESFAFAEAGGIVATPRGAYASEEVTKAAAAALGDDHSYWPCFVFVPRTALLATDYQLGAVLWKPGQVIFGKRLQGQSVSDTFVWASYQLRAQGLDERQIDNHRLSGQWLPDAAPWFHVGSLSSGHGFTFMGDTSEERYLSEVNAFKHLPPGNAAQRMAWWRRVWECAEGAIPEYHRRYGKELDQFRHDIGLDEADIEEFRRLNELLITWAER